MELVARYNKALLTPCKHIADVDNDMRPYLPELIRIMRVNEGIGITANQVGHNDAVFITNVEGDHIRIFINPEIISESTEEIRAREGCLCFPGKHLHTYRKRHVVIRAFSLKGHEFILDTRMRLWNPQVSMMMSVCMQHEMDHINGIDMREYL